MPFYLCVTCGIWTPVEAENAEPYFGCCGAVECRCSVVSAVHMRVNPVYVEKAHLAQQALMLSTLEGV